MMYNSKIQAMSPELEKLQTKDWYKSDQLDTVTKVVINQDE